MNAPPFKTRAEQRIDRLESLRRPLTDAESDELRRSFHAVYCHKRRQRMLAAFNREEAALADRIVKEWGWGK